MSKGVKLHVWGDYALFTRPEMKVERVSYEVMTPSAARNILTAIYWKPQIRWVVDYIHILKPIAFTSVRRNEVASKAVTPSAAIMNGAEKAVLGLCSEDDRQQRASLVLCNVGYVIEAHFDVVERTLEVDGPEIPEEVCAAKHISIFNRRAIAGQAFHQPYLGCREFPAHFALIGDGEALPPCELPNDQRNKDFGWMFHDFIYREDKKGKIIESNKGRKLTAEPRFFHAKAENGVIRIPALNGKEVVA